jgi:hypothetical protein
MPNRDLRLLPLPLLVAWALINGCTVKEVRLGDVADSGPVFAETPDAGPDVVTETLMCIGTQCPAPFTTCNTAGVPTYLCGTDLSRDHDNCGSCGNSCGNFEQLHMASRCVTGACQFECFNPNPQFRTDWRNCNELIDDGCEIDVLKDAKNCGSCGHVCDAGESCNDGKCGCPSGQKECPWLFGTKRCVDTQNDDNNCGDCGTVCDSAGPAGSCDPLPSNSHYGCFGGTCDHLKCDPRTADCDGDLGTLGCASNGCEVGALADRENCGGCGIKCKAGEECVTPPGSSGLVCTVPCGTSDLTFCATRGECTDVLTDVKACGRCDNECPAGGPNQVRACHKGVCALDCAPGFADCNQDQTDGCETNLLVNPNNCGACGSECNLALGQPCIEGKCLMAPCGTPGAK